MKKTLTKTKSNSLVYFIIVLLRCIAYVPEPVLGVNIENLSISFEPVNLLNLVSLVLFSAVCAFVISKLTSDSGAAIFIALLFLLDPIFKHSLFSISHAVILSAMALVILYALRGKSAVIKWLFAIVFSGVSVFVCPEAVLSYAPLVAFVCTLSDFNKPAADKKNSKKALLSVVFFAALVAVCIVAWMLNKNLHSVANFVYSFNFTSLSISLQYHLPRFLVANIPFIIILAVFFRNYLRVKTSGKHFGLIICFVAVYAATVTGAFVFNYAESFTLTNQLIVVTLAAVYCLDKDNATQALSRITDWFKGHPYLTIAVIAAWILITQSLFQEMQQTIWSKIITTTGELV